MGSFPAFQGAKPYHQAHARGVKLVGATAHYATKGSGSGPDHRAGRGPGGPHHAARRRVARLGRDVERVVLARAVRAHLERRVIVEGRRTIVVERAAGTRFDGISGARCSAQLEVLARRRRRAGPVSVRVTAALGGVGRGWGDLPDGGARAGRALDAQRGRPTEVRRGALSQAGESARWGYRWPCWSNGEVWPACRRAKAPI